MKVKELLLLVGSFLYMVIGTGCHIYNGMTMVSPHFIQRYSTQPKPVHTVQVGLGGGSGFNALQPMEYEHPGLDTSEVNIRWDYTVDELFIIWQAGKKWDLGLGWTDDDHTAGDEVWIAKGFTLSSMINFSKPQQWLQHASLNQFSWLKKGYQSTIDYHDWDAIAEEYRFTYSHLFSSNPMDYRIQWGFGGLLSFSYLKLKSRYNDGPFTATVKKKIYPGLRWFIGFKTGDMQVGYEQITLWPLTDENISWNAGASFSLDIFKKG